MTWFILSGIEYMHVQYIYMHANARNFSGKQGPAVEHAKLK